MSTEMRSGVEISEDRYRLLVPLSTEVASGSVERRLRTAAAIARERGGGVVVCYLATVARQTPLDGVPSDHPILAEAHETTEEFVESATRADVPAMGRIHLSHDESKSVLDAVETHEFEGVVLSIKAGRSQRRRLLGGDTAEKVVARAGCEVFVEKQAVDETPIRRILLAVSGGPHSELAAKTARALAIDSTARVDVVHFLGRDASANERNQGERIIETTERILADIERVETQSESTENVAEAIVARSDEYDVTILGAPTGGLLEQFVFGTIPDSVNRGSENAVVMAQQDTGSTSVYGRWIAGDPPE
jgi:nucleotide-binding universal stress UspA family protein